MQIPRVHPKYPRYPGNEKSSNIGYWQLGWVPGARHLRLGTVEARNLAIYVIARWPRYLQLGTYA